MKNCRKIIISSIVTGLLILNPLYITHADAVEILKKGETSQSVKEVQIKLKQLGYFQSDVTGYYGPITENAVKKFQRACGIKADGVVGPQTLKYIDKYLAVDVSRNANINRQAMMPWFGKAEKAFPIGAIATITDIETGLQFKAKRTYGYNHADCETLTAEDTKIYKKIFGGQFKWEMRAIIVEYNDQKLAASMAGMPHAGREDKPANAWVGGRSGGFGTGTNLDAIKGNEMSGHFDIHFLGSKTHGTNKIDNRHQVKIIEAAKHIK